MYLFPVKNSLQILQKVIVLLLGRDRALIFTYLITQLQTFWPTTAYLFQFQPSSGETGAQSWREMQTLGSSLFNENSNPLNIFTNNGVLPKVRMLALLDHIWGNKGPKTYQKGLFHGC